MVLNHLFLLEIVSYEKVKSVLYSFSERCRLHEL